MELSENEKKFRKYLKKYYRDKYNQLIAMETTEKNKMIADKVVKTNKIELCENEKKFRAYLKKYHPDKYDKLIIMETEEESTAIIVPV